MPGVPAYWNREKTKPAAEYSCFFEYTYRRFYQEKY